MNGKGFIQIVCILLIGFVFPGLASAAEKPRIHYLAVVPFHAPEKIVHLYTPVINYLNKSTKKKWELKLYPSHNAIAEGICNNEFSVGLFGPLLASKTYELCGTKPLLVALGKDGKPHFRVVLVTADPWVKSVRDLRGKKVGIFKAGTVAHHMTKKFFDDDKIPFDSVEFQEFRKLEDILNEVLTGSLTAGGVRESAYERFKGFNLKNLKTSDPMPGFAFFASPQLDKATQKTFMKALLALKPLKRKTDQSIVEAWDEEIKSGFVLPPERYIEDVIKIQELEQRYR